MRRLINIILAVYAAVAFATMAQAQGLQRFDMSQIPLTEINLKGGSYLVSLRESQSHFVSHLIIECQNCATPTNALVGLTAETGSESADFARDPVGYLNELSVVCTGKTLSCTLSQSTVGGMKGYALAAQYPGDFYVVEHVYFSNGLEFVINAAAPTLDMAKFNVATLIQVAGPYVTGQKR